MQEKHDVLIIGGGCTGLGIARSLAQAGRKVALLEAGELGQEASRASAGMIGPQSEALGEDDYFESSLASRDLYPDFVERLRRETGLDLGYRRGGALHLAFGASYEKRLEAKYLWQLEK